MYIRVYKATMYTWNQIELSSTKLECIFCSLSVISCLLGAIFVIGEDDRVNILSTIGYFTRGLWELGIASLQNLAFTKFKGFIEYFVHVKARLRGSLAKKEGTLKVHASESFPSLPVTDGHHQNVFQRNSSIPRREKDECSSQEATDCSYDGSSFSSISLPVVEFEVFLSFRGPDTRKGFADCLYCGLTKAGIRVFRDIEGLHIGENLRELLIAINSSKICIPILSKGYASSSWCLRELVEMMECSKSTRIEIFPIFYDVKPSEVQLDKGPYVEALRQHKKQFDPKIVQQWEDALREVGRIKGWELQKATNGHEGKLIELVVRKVLVSLKVHHLNVADHLVAINDHVAKITRILNMDAGDVRIGGIYGMGGIGKTTLAKIVYNQLSGYFEYCSFLADVRETSQNRGLEYLQNQLISQTLKDKAPDITNIDEGIKIIKERLHGKEVLVLLDDIDKRMQLQALVGNGAWFSSGSKIIITTRNKDILNVPEIDWTYELNAMDFEPSLQLFSRHAFRRDYPPDDYFGYSEKVVEITGGLPLALENIGSFLSGKSKEVWDSTLKKLEKLPHEEVEKKLRISYDALDDLQKHIFLDIACLFIGYDRGIAVHMWDESMFFPKEGIEVLLLLSMIKIVEDNKLWMHDQLRDLGRKIVYQENNFEPGKRSRLWNHHESVAILEGKKGSELIHALCLKFSGRNQYLLKDEQFVNLSNLRFLQVNGGDLSGNFENLLPELRWLCWHYCPSRFLLTNFHPTNLVVLDLSWSKITEDWEGWRHIKMAKNLKVLNLTGCISLFRIPEFSGFVGLERLILKGCEGLVEIGTSLDGLRHLNSLNIQDCYCIQKLPENLYFMESLRELIVDGTSIQEISIPPGCLKKLEILSARNCRSLVEVSSSIGYLETLSHLALDNSRITCLPNSVGKLIRLERLSLRGCRLLSGLPVSIGQLESLEFLDLSCTRIMELPNSVEKMKQLKVLILEGSCINRIPPVIGMLEKLEEINAKSCKSLDGEIPSEIGKLVLLRILSLSDSRTHGLPATISRLSNLHTLDMDLCNELRFLPELPASLICLRVSSHSMEEIPDLSDLDNLKYLYLSDNSHERGSLEGHSSKPMCIPSPQWIGMLTKLETLHLSVSRITTLPSELSRLHRLKKLVLFCVDLQCVLQLPPNLSTLCIGYCNSMSVLSDLSDLKNLLELELLHSPITEIHGLGSLTSLQILDVTNCRLWKLDGLGQLGSLRRLILDRCDTLELLPDMSGLKKMKDLKLRDCEKLVMVEGLRGLESLEVLQISGCGSLEQLFDDPSELRQLKLLEVKECNKLQETLSSSLGRLPNVSDLKVLKVSELGSREMIRPSEAKARKLPELPSFKTLKYLYTEDSE